MNPYPLKRDPAISKKAFWITLAAAQILFLCVVSRLAGNATIDNDAGKVFTHMMAIWEAGSLAVPNWQYITTMELDCTTLLALPFYGLTHNPTLAFWCGNVILLAGWAALLYTLVRRLGGGPAKASLAVLVVLLPYELYTTGYWNMLFLNASQYAFKVMLPLLLVVLLLAPERPRRRDWVLLAIYVVGCWLTAFSSGIYVAACGLAPVLCLGLYNWLRGRLHATLYRLSCFFGSVAATLVGLIAQHLLGITTSASSMTLNSLETIRDNAVNCLIGFFRLFGAVPEESQAVFSLAGISALLRMAMAAAVLALALWVSVRAVLGLLPARLGSVGYLASIFWWNLAVLLATNTRYGDKYFEYRYHLIGAIPLLVLAVYVFPALVSHPARMRRAAAGIGAVLALTLVGLVDFDAVRSIWKPDGTFGANGPEREICGVIGSLDVQDVIITTDTGTTEICAALDPSRRYVTLMSLEGQDPMLSTQDGSLTDTDGISYTRPAAIVCSAEDGIDSLPQYLAEQCVEVGRAAGCLILRTEGAPLVDGYAGLPYGTQAIDYPNTTWYTYHGEIDAQRRLHTDLSGGEVLRSAALTFHTDTEITLSCKTVQGADEVGMLQLWSGDQLLCESAVPAGETQVSLFASAGEGYALVLTLNPGVEAVIGPIHFEAAL